MHDSHQDGEDEDRRQCFGSHEDSATRKTSVETVITLPKKTCDVGEMLSSTLAIQKRTNREYLLKVAQNVWFLARQGIPLCGDGDEVNGNLMQLLHLRGADDPQILIFLQQRTVYKPTDKKWTC